MKRLFTMDPKKKRAFRRGATQKFIKYEKTTSSNSFSFPNPLFGIIPSILIACSIIILSGYYLFITQYKQPLSFRIQAPPISVAPISHGFIVLKNTIARTGSSIHIPQIPKISYQFHAPHITAPTITLPKISYPVIQVPKVKIPHISFALPKISYKIPAIPQVRMPQIPQITVKPPPMPISFEQVKVIATFLVADNRVRLEPIFEISIQISGIVLNGMQTTIQKIDFVGLGTVLQDVSVEVFEQGIVSGVHFIKMVEPTTVSIQIMRILMNGTITLWNITRNIDPTPFVTETQRISQIIITSVMNGVTQTAGVLNPQPLFKKIYKIAESLAYTTADVELTIMKFLGSAMQAIIFIVQIVVNFIVNIFWGLVHTIQSLIVTIIRTILNFFDAIWQKIAQFFDFIDPRKPFGRIGKWYNAKMEVVHHREEKLRPYVTAVTSTLNRSAKDLGSGFTEFFALLSVVVTHK